MDLSLRWREPATITSTISSLHYESNHISSNNFSLQIPTFDQKHNQTNRSNTFAKHPSLLPSFACIIRGDPVSQHLCNAPLAPTTHLGEKHEPRERRKEGTKQHLSHLSIASIFIRLHLQVRERDLGKPRRASERRCCLSVISIFGEFQVSLPYCLLVCVLLLAVKHWAGGELKPRPRSK